ncbi:MAG: M28 family peptidase [Bacteroidota bacterium]|nr:M28 family peptidase [Bacteroidota bacterium]
MKKLLLPVSVFLLTGISGIAQRGQKQAVDFASQYAQTITAAELKEKLSIIASREMEGRETASPGQKKAAAYIESQFHKFGLLPGTTGGYQMQYPIYQDTLLEASLKVGGTYQKLDTAFSLNIASAPNGTFNIKEIIFASYGIVDSSRNDYRDVDVKGKWVLIFEGTPGSPAPVFDRRSPYSVRAKVEQATRLGAKGVFIMSSDFPKRASETKGSMYLKKPANFTANVPAIIVSSDVAHLLLGLNPTQLLQSIKNIPVGAYNSDAQFTINKRTLLLQSSNVIALLPGTDKADEYVLITGHYDHLGTRGKEIFYGADDDGSGTTSVIEIAEAFAKAKNEGHGPRRNIVFMTVSGEEKGLLGSEFYSENPVFPLSKVSVDLNIDMVGRIDPKYKGDSLNYVYIIGDDKLSSDLAPITDSVNKAYMKMQLDRRFNDLKDPNRYYYRSDHFNFAKNGVPVIFYFNGTHADYHRSTDTVDKINFDLMAKRVKLVFYTAWEMANRNAMVKRNIPLEKL